MRLQMGRIDHQRVSSAALIRQFQKHPGEDTFLAPPLPSAIKGLVRPILRRRIAQRKPLRLMNIMPLITRLSSTRGLPWDFGKKGSSLAICVSLSQYRSLMSSLRFRSRESRGAAEINAS